MNKKFFGQAKKRQQVRLTILLGSDGELGGGGPLPPPGLGGHPDVVDGVGVQVLQDDLRCLRALQCLVVWKFLRDNKCSGRLRNLFTPLLIDLVCV